VAEDHETVVQIAHQSGELELENVVEGCDYLGVSALLSSEVMRISAEGVPADVKPCGGVSYMSKRICRERTA